MNRCKTHSWAREENCPYCVIDLLGEQLQQLRTQSAREQREFEGKLALFTELDFKIASRSSIPCARCGGVVIEFSVPNDIWNAIVRRDAPEGSDEYMCHACWLRALRAFAKQSAREHAAWEAMRKRQVVSLRKAVSGDCWICLPRWNGRWDGHGEIADDPVDAVWKVVEAAKQEAGTEPAAGTETEIMDDSRQ